jgi:glycerol-3-phosphate acyltransferase PlsY
MHPDLAAEFADWPASAWGVIGLGYLVGSIPCGLIVARAVAGVDPREVGSGNIGATNTARAVGREWGVFVGACDALKGLLPVWLLAGTLFSEHESRLAIQIFTGVAAVLGHCWSIFLRLGGGKGVATACGVILALDWRVFLIGGLVWLAVLAATRFVGLASMTMVATFAVASWLVRPDDALLSAGAALLTGVVILRHRANLKRMFSGSEPKLGSKKR